MPQQETNEVITETPEEMEVIDTTTVPETPAEKPFWKTWKFILSLFGIVLFILLIWGIVHVFTVYKNAEKYKKAFDITQEQLDECDRIEGTSQPKERFDYCDQLNDNYKNVERE